MQKNPHFRASFEFDPGIERTFHKLKKQKVLEESTSTPMMARGEEAQRRTLRDYVILGAHIKTPSIAMPVMVANDFGLNPALSSMV